MKRFPYKLRISLWYTAFMVVILASTLSIIYAMSSSSLLNKTEESVSNAIAKAHDYIKYENGVLKYNDRIQSIDDTVTIVIYDKYGNTLYGVTPRQFPVDANFSNTFQSIQLPNQNRFVYKDLDVAVKGAPQNLIIRGIASYTNANTTLQSFLFASLIIGPVVILLAAYGGWRLMKRIFKPIEAVRTTAQEISDGNDLKLRIEAPSNNDELGKLVHTLNHMLQRLDDAFDRERQFTDDISHELRTPLTGMLLDVELMKLRSDKEDLETQTLIKRLYEQTQWMVTLVESMTQISHSIHIQSIETVFLKESIEAMPTLDLQKITLDIPDTQIIQTDTALFGRILTNLVNNSFQYGADRVDISTQRVRGTLHIKIKDNGDGMSEETLSQIWNRFYQGDKARHDSKSSGLGLSFVKMAVDALGWEIQVASELGTSTTFTLIIKD